MADSQLPLAEEHQQCGGLGGGRDPGSLVKRVSVIFILRCSMQAIGTSPLSESAVGTHIKVNERRPMTDSH